MRGTSLGVGTSITVTSGIKISVRSEYVPDQSSPNKHRYVFAYTVRIANEGTVAAQLRTRHWVITDAEGKTEEVRGPGVIGKQPLIGPGEAFEYTSGCVLATPRGQMRGSYEMHSEDGVVFDADISPFEMALPYSLN